jgi:hypothetical protein
MTPSATIIEAASAGRTITDAGGRRITLRRMTALDKLRLFKAAGPELANNDRWLAMAMLASAVTALDDIPLPLPVNETLIEAAVAKLGDQGIEAVAAALHGSGINAAEQRAIAGN